MLETWFVYLLLATIFYALSTVLDKELMILDLSPSETVTLKMTLDGANVFLILFLFGKIVLPSTLRLWFFIALVALFYAVQMAMYFYSLKFSDITKAIPVLTASNVVVSFTGGAILFSDAVSKLNVLGGLLIVAGSFVVLSEGKLVLPKEFETIKYMFLSGVAGAISGLVAKQTTFMFDPLNLALFMYMFVALYLNFYNFTYDYEKQVNMIKTVTQNKKIFSILYISSFFAAVGTLLYYSSLSLGEASKVIPILISLYMFFVLFIGEKTFHEKHFIYRMLGSLIMIAGIYAIYL